MRTYGISSPLPDSPSYRLSAPRPRRIPIFLPSAPYNPTTSHTTLVVLTPCPTGIMTLKLRGDFALHVSVYNPNRFDIQLDQGHATFLYQGSEVGVWHSDESINTPAGTVTDLDAVISFSPSIAQATAMKSDLSAGQLNLDVSGTLLGVARFPIFYNYPFELSFAKHRMLIGADSDRSLCVCPA